ncbi:hypothetical protein RIF29_25431 [Crotalaria pallida]|uniref:Protein FAM136A n=1 Tax=Crotalaria pallida TaxID=3830 RepID=A0AAN9ENZ4_CROPI
MQTASQIFILNLTPQITVQKPRVNDFIMSSLNCRQRTHKLSSYCCNISEYQMDHFAVTEEQIASQRLRQKLDEVNEAAQTHLAPIQDHVNFTLQKAYFKCAHECFDRSRSQEEITNCVENCSVPLSRVQETLESEMAQFQESLQRSLMVCQDKYEAAKLQQKPGAVNDLLSCADLSIKDGIKMLPLLTNKFKASFGIRDNRPS